MIAGVSDGLAGFGGAALAAGAAACLVRSASHADRSIADRIAGRGAPSVRTWSMRTLAAHVGRMRLVGRLGRASTAAARLHAARLPLDVDVFVGAKALAAASVVPIALLGPPPLPMLAPVLVAGALLVPDMALVRVARRRRARIEAQLPQFLDLLAAGSTAGLSALLALRRAAASVREPLHGELDALLERVDLGARWRPELHGMAERLELADLRRAVMAMTRTESLGTPLAESLRRRADEVREARRAGAAERARKAPVKMLFPLVFMILPAFLLLTVVPVLLSTLRSVR
jgi:tight adherence protein C